MKRLDLGRPLFPVVAPLAGLVVVRIRKTLLIRHAVLLKHGQCGINVPTGVATGRRLSIVAEKQIRL
jgi:hypothetical protein